MSAVVVEPEPMVDRQVFAAWSVRIPACFHETFVSEDSYWHAWDLTRSVSLTSVVVNDRHGRPIEAARILRRFPSMKGERMALAPGQSGWAVVVSVAKPRRAARAISGILVADGAVLIATVTSDDLSWARSIWASIRRHE